MRQPCLRAAIGGVLLLLAAPAWARETFKIPNTLPGSYEDLYKVIKKDLEKDGDTDKQKQKEKENISAYLDKAQCGGWNMELSVEGRIAKTENLPGREGDWKGNIPSGMALRDDALTYPDGATGLFTACEDSRFESEKTAWRDDAQGRIPITVNYPYFEDPPCLWLDNAPVDGPQTPEKCQEFATWTNGYTYADCRDENIVPVFDDEGNYLFSFCAKWEDRYVCSDEWVAGGRGNSAACSGSECRCDGTLASCVTSPFNGRPYRSFYRKYDARYQRQAVSDAPKDVTNKDARFGCYGLYEEFDPKTHQTREKDKRCIADINLEEMKKTQLGKGKYGQDSNLPDPPAAKRNDGKYDKDKDGRLSQAEFAADKEWIEHFGWLDANSDNFLIAQEWNAARDVGIGDFGAIAIQPGATKGQLPQDAIRWRVKRNLPYIPAPVLYRDVYYMVKTGGIVTSLDPATGRILKQGRSPNAIGEYFASPVAADGKVFLSSEDGRITVLRAGAEWEVLSVNDLAEEIHATPALSEGRLYVRARGPLDPFASPR